MNDGVTFFMGKAKLYSFFSLTFEFFIFYEKLDECCAMWIYLFFDQKSKIDFRKEQMSANPNLIVLKNKQQIL